jgi:hypothetical protein
MAEDGRRLVEQSHREAFQGGGEEPRSPAEPTTLHYTELAPMAPNSPLYHEWNVYRREVGRLLAEGHEGKFVLIKGEEMVGLFRGFEGGVGVGRAEYLLQPFLVQQVREREPVLRIRGYNLPCPSGTCPSPAFPVSWAGPSRVEWPGSDPSGNKLDGGPDRARQSTHSPR